MKSNVRIVRAATNQLGEGPHWAVREQRLYWVDILESAIHSMNANGSGLKTIIVGELIGAVLPCRDGGLLAAVASGIYHLNESGVKSLLVSPESNVTGNRFNDGKCDSRGRLWIGSLSTQSRKGAGCLWKITSDGSSQLMETGLDISNGLGWSPNDRFFYLTDSGQGVIHKYDFDSSSGAIVNRRPFAKVDKIDGVPDGLTVDADGFVWSARWDGGCVVRYDPTGVIERKVEISVPRPTSCALGGSKGTTLFVTSARVGLTDTELKQFPDSGSVFAFDVSTQGLPENQFG